MLMRCAPVFALLTLAAPLAAQQVKVETFVLDNGMKFLLVPRSDQPNVIAAGWVAKVGSVNERPGITGISHFFEHMMFKGTTSIGTKDPVRDREIIEELATVREDLRELQLGPQYRRLRRGEIDDPWDAAHDTPQMTKLREQMRALMEQQREITVKDEFDHVYANLGGSGVNAFTNEDVTFYFVNVPSNKFELWAWMESDRIGDSVFREFYAERDVVHEERRLTTESTPTGIFQEQFDAMFWQSSPYSWPVVGWPDDLNSYTREQAEAYYDIYYRPNNLVGVVVGDFDPSAVRSQVGKYFSRLKPGPEVPPVVTTEMPQIAEKRMLASGDCPPQVEVRYHTVPLDHADSFALDILASLLNGRTGRLYRNLVEGQEIAARASARSASRKYAGLFSVQAECKGEAKPEDLEQAWYQVLAELQEQDVPDRELQKVKNQLLADSYRRLEQNFMLMLRLGLYEAMVGWEYINESPGKLQAVSKEDIRRVAEQYFDAGNRCVAIYTRKAGLEPEDPALEALAPQVRAVVNQLLGSIHQLEDGDELRLMKAEMESQLAEIPEEFVVGIRYVLEKLQERIDTLESGSQR